MKSYYPVNLSLLFFYQHPFKICYYILLLYTFISLIKILSLLLCVIIYLILYLYYYVLYTFKSIFLNIERKNKVRYNIPIGKKFSFPS